MPLPGRGLAVVADEANAERCAKGTFHTFVLDVRAPDNPVPIAEDWPVRGVPDFEYARDKAESDRLCQLWALRHPDPGRGHRLQGSTWRARAPDRRHSHPVQNM